MGYQKYKKISALLVLSIFSLPGLCAPQLYGVSSFQEFGSEKFIGALYLEVPGDSPEIILNTNQSIRMEMRLTDTMSRRALLNLWMQSIAINNDREPFEAEADSVAGLFKTITGKLQPGDIIRLDYSRAQGTAFSINDHTFSAGGSRTLFGLFLRAWIGPVPPSTQFRENILALNGLDQVLADRLRALKPEPARTSQIAAWLQPLPPENEEIAEKSVASAETDETESTSDDETIAQNATSETPQPAPAEESAIAEKSEESGTPLSEDDEKTDEPDLSAQSLLAQQDYSTHVVRSIYKALRYPKSAIRKNQEGSVRIRVDITRDGRLETAVIVERADYDSLNDAAIKAARKAAPFDAVPEAIQDDVLQVTIPIAFRLIEN